MTLLTWIPLGFLVVAVLGPIAVAVLAGLRAWRRFRMLSRHAGTAVESVLAAAAEAERHAVSLAENGERLKAAIAHLQESLAHLAVLRAAFANAKSGLTFRMPTK